jgi:hypothetical protein
LVKIGFKQGFLGGTVLVAMTLLPGCGTTGATPSAGYSQVRFINGIIGMNGMNAAPPNVNVSSTGPNPPTVSTLNNLSETGVSYAGASPYSLVPSGSVTITVALPGTVPPRKDWKTDYLPFNMPETFQPGMSHTLIAAGQIGSMVSPPILVLLTDVIPTTATSSTTLAFLRVINLVPVASAATMPISVYSSGAPILGLSDIGYGNATGYTSVPAGSLALTVSDPQSGAQVSPSSLAGATNLIAGKAYTLYVFTPQATAGTGLPQPAVDAHIIPDN